MIQRCIRLDNQAVQAQVIGSQCQRLFERVGPVFDLLPRQPKDKVQVDIFESCAAGCIKRKIYILYGVNPAQELQLTRLETLHTHTEPVNAQTAQAGKLGTIDGARVCLTGNLAIGGDGEIGMDGGKQLGQRFPTEYGGGAAAHKDGR